MSKKIHPLLSALVSELQTDTIWPLERRVAWLKMAAMAFDLVHGQTVAIAIDAPPLMSVGVDLREERPSDAVIDFGQVRAAINGHKPATSVAAGGPRLDRPLQGDQVYFVDLAGRVFRRERNDFGVAIGPGKRINAPDLGPDATLWDMRAGEAPLNALEWADGTRGAPLAPVQVLTG